MIPISRAAGLTLLAAGALALGGCAALESPNQAQMIKDMTKLESKVDDMMDRQADTERKLTGQLGSMSSDDEKRIGIVQNVLDDMEGRLRAIEEELRASRGQLEEMTVSMRSLENKLGLQGTISGGGSSTSSGYGAGTGNLTPAGGATTPTPAPATATAASPGTVEQAISQGMDQHNLGNYAAATQLFQRALEMGPTEDQKLDALFWIGESNFKSGELNAAMANYLEVIQTNRRSQQAWRSLEQMAQINYRQGELDKALALLKNFEQNPGYEYIQRVNDLRTTIQNEQGGPSVPGQ